MENEASRRRECVVALRIREKREDVEEERKEERSGTSGDRDGSRKRHGGEGKPGKRDTQGAPERRSGEKRAAEPAERLGRFIPEQLHFQPSSEYKRQFNYRGIFKGGSSLLSSLLSSFFGACLFLHPRPLRLSTVYL